MIKIIKNTLLYGLLLTSTLLAASLLTLRFAAPYIINHNAVLTKIAANTNTTIIATPIVTTWHGWSLNFSIKAIKVAANDTTPLAITINNVKASVNLLHSLFLGKLITNISRADLQMLYKRQDSSNIAIAAQLRAAIAYGADGFNAKGVVMAPHISTTSLNDINFSVVETPASYITIIEKIQVSQLIAAATKLQLYDKQLQHILTNIDIAAVLTKPTIKVDKNSDDYLVVTRIDNWRNQQFDRLPQITGASAVLKIQPNIMQLQFVDNNLQVVTAAKQEFNIENFNAIFKIKNQPLPIVKAKDLKATINGNKVYLDLNYDFNNADAFALKAMIDSEIEFIHQALPNEILNPGIQYWIKQAVKNGRIKAAALWQGDAANYPFDNNNGKFLLDAMVTGVDIKFHSGWLPLENTNGAFRMVNDSLIAEVVTAKLGENNIYETRGEFLDISKQLQWQVNGEAAGDLLQAMEVVNVSPLANGIGKQLSELDFKGEYKLKLNLKQENLDAAVETIGVVTATDATAKVMSTAELSNINGDFIFTHNGLDADNITASLWRHDFNINIATVTGDLNVTAATRINVDNIKQYSENKLLQNISGESDFVATIKMPFTAAENGTLELQSDLQGIAINLPPPFHKDKEETRKLLVSKKISQGDKLQIWRANLGQEIDAIFENNYASPRGQIKINAGIAQLPTTGIEISGNLEKIQLEQWKSTLSGSSNSENLITVIDLKVKQLEFWKQVFNNVSFKAKPHGDGWFVETKSNKIAGKITVYPNEVYVNLKKLYLNKVDSTTAKEKLDLNNLNLMLSIDDFHWGKLAVGVVAAKISQEDNKTIFKKLNISNDLFTLNADGQTFYKDKDVITNFYGTLVCNDIGKLLDGVGKKNTVTGGHGDVKFNVIWPQSISDFSLEKAIGDIRIKFKDGYLETVKPGFGRVVSLLSVENLHRRLKLDFADVTSKGFAFDRVDGDLSLKQSQVVTRNLQISGSAAAIDLKGDLNLSNKTIDMLALVSPKFTSTLPVAAALVVGNPLIGATMWAVDKLLSPEISDLTHYRYTISGSLDSPKIATTTAPPRNTAYSNN